jgi:hypothetical protein
VADIRHRAKRYSSVTDIRKRAKRYSTVADIRHRTKKHSSVADIRHSAKVLAILLRFFHLLSSEVPDLDSVLYAAVRNFLQV